MTHTGLKPRIGRLRVQVPNGTVYDWYNVDTVRMLRYAGRWNKADEVKAFHPEDGS